MTIPKQSRKRKAAIASGEVRVGFNSTIVRKPIEQGPGMTSEEYRAYIEKAKVKRPKKKEEITYPMAEKMLDAVFAQWVKLKSADANGIVRCFICSIPMKWKYSVLMHFQTRTCLPLQWDEIACQAGCRKCNGKDNGDRISFGFRLDGAYGKGTAQRLIDKGRNVVDGEKVEPPKYSVDQLLTLARWYRERIQWIREHDPGKF